MKNSSITSLSLPEKKRAALVEALSAWFERVQRPLPWRQTRDPYRIWISEVMLQQTQVAAVLPYYERFLQRFPTVAALAQAPEQDVLAYWSGLGYYSRARSLRKGAIHLIENRKGIFPRTREEVLEIPGIGPYTAGAVLSIAFDLPEPLVDGNVQRVFSRFFAFEPLLESAEAKAFFWDQAAIWVKASRSPRFFNQALMELGATVCTKAQPKCGLCPLKDACRARAQDRASEFPKRKPRRAAEKLWWASLLHQTDGKLLLVQNPQGAWWSGLWDFPKLEASTREDVANQTERTARAEGWKVEHTLAWQEHTVTHHRIHVAPVVLGWKGNARSGKTRRWVTPQQARELPLSSLAKKILTAYEGEKR